MSEGSEHSMTYEFLKLTSWSFFLGETSRNKAQTEEAGAMKTKEIEGPDKNRQEEQSQEISKYRGQFFSVLKKKVQELEI